MICLVVAFVWRALSMYGNSGYVYEHKKQSPVSQVDVLEFLTPWCGDIWELGISGSGRYGSSLTKPQTPTAIDDVKTLTSYLP